MQVSLSLNHSRQWAVSRRRVRAGYRRIAFKAFPRLTSFIVL